MKPQGQASFGIGVVVIEKPNSVYTDHRVRITIDIDDEGFGSFCP
jgi:hypothetical protein